MEVSKLIVQVKQVMQEEGVFDQEDLFFRLKHLPVHYAKLRRAIHLAKAGIFK